jgi:ribonuclease G
MSEKLFILTTAYKKTVGLLLDDGKPWDLRCYDEESRLGNIYVGRISNVLGNISAAFIDIEKGLSCYLPFDELPEGKKVKIGDVLTVQLVRESLKTKQPSVTTKLSLTGQYVVLTLGQTVGVSSKIKDVARRDELKQLLETELNTIYNSIFQTETESSDRLLFNTLSCIGGIIRTQAENANNETISAEIKSLYMKICNVLKNSQYASIYSCLLKNRGKHIEDVAFFMQQEDTRVITDITDVAEAVGDKSILYTDKICPLNALYNVERIIEKALSKVVYLKSGAYLVIEPTEAMTVIDVNSGKAIKGKNSEAALHKINLEAADEVARQLRLRNISGIIMIDFISSKSEKLDKELLKELESATSRDYVLTNVVDITRLGLVEVTRKKVRKTLYECMYESVKKHLT